MPTDLKKQISHSIRDARSQRGLTQKELGERIGVTESAVARYESGSLNMSVAVMSKIADALDLDMEIVFKAR